jgi:predicted acyl esterase
VDLIAELVEREGRPDRLLVDGRVADGGAAQSPKGLATIIPQGFGAGVGRVKPYYEQGNWYRGGAVQMLFIDWLYGEQNQVRPTFPPGRRRRTDPRGKSFDLAQQLPPVDWAKAFWHLPTKDLLKVWAAARHLRRLDAGHRDRRGDDPAHA